MVIDWLARPMLALLRDKEEDRFTEYLCQLLQAESFLAAFLTKLCDLPRTGVNPAEMSVRTQVTIEGGRPDLVITGSGFHLIFEAKVGSWLHGDQVVPYAKELLGLK